MTMGRTWNEGHTFLLVTGSSRGLGQAFAIALAGNILPNSVIYLTARTESALIETRNEILKKNERLHVKYFVADQANSERQTYIKMLEDLRPDKFTSAIVIHNAGSIGRQGQMVEDYDDKEEMCNYYNLNLFSVAVLNSVFMKTFSSGTNLYKNGFNYLFPPVLV